MNSTNPNLFFLRYLLNICDSLFQTLDHLFLADDFGYFKYAGAGCLAGQGDPHGLGNLAEFQTGLVHNGFKGVFQVFFGKCLDAAQGIHENLQGLPGSRF